MLLQTRGLSKAFHGTYALRDVDLSLDRGQVLGLVGENGAGKSTLIKLLTGVYRLEEGQLLWRTDRYPSPPPCRPNTWASAPSTRIEP